VGLRKEARLILRDRPAAILVPMERLRPLQGVAFGREYVASHAGVIVSLREAVFSCPVQLRRVRRCTPQDPSAPLAATRSAFAPPHVRSVREYTHADVAGGRPRGSARGPARLAASTRRGRGDANPREPQSRSLTPISAAWAPPRPARPLRGRPGAHRRPGPG